MSHVADSPQNRLFDPISGRFTPIRPTNHRWERKGPPTLWHPGNLVGPQRPPGHCSPPHVPRRRPPGPAGSGRAQTLPRWLLPATKRRISKDRTGPDLDEQALYLIMRRPPVDRSLVAGGAPRQRFEACLPDAHQPQYLFSRCSPWFPGIRPSS